MRRPEVNTWNGKDRDLDLSVLDIGKWFPGKTPKAVVGWNGIKVWDKSVDPVALLAAYLEKAKDESCGQCAPCRLGTVRMAAHAQKLAAGTGTQRDLSKIRFLAVQVSRTARCDIGRTLAKPVLDLMDTFSEDFKAAAAGYRILMAAL